jgi:predicted esterase
MPFATFAELSEEMFRLYGRGEYEAALALVNRDFEHFTDYLGRLYFWRVCLHTMLDQQDEALHQLKQALDLGFGYSVDLLHGDRDLQSLQRKPEFEQLVTRSQEQYAELSSHIVSTRLIIPPPEAAAPFPLLIILHGNSSNAEWTAGYWQAAAERGWLVLLPQSSQPGWDNTSFSWDDEEKARRDVLQHYQEIQQKYQIDPERVVIGGFSRGARVALSLALTGSIPARGVIAVAPALRQNSDELFALAQLRLEHAPSVYLIVGEQDQPFYEPTIAFAEYLSGLDVDCELSVYPHIGHAYPSDFADVLPVALDFVMQVS